MNYITSVREDAFASNDQGDRPCSFEGYSADLGDRSQNPSNGAPHVGLFSRKNWSAYSNK